MRKMILTGGAALAAVLALPMIATAEMPGGGHDMKAPLTRASAEAKVKAMFAKADTNKDGAVTQAEVKAAMDARRATRFGQMFDRLDANKDGQISRAEFVDGHKPGGHDPDGPGPKGIAVGEPNPSAPSGMGGMGMKHHGMGGMMGARMFEKADADKDGKVTLAEATRAALTHFDAVDANKDGTITPEERKAFHEKMRAEWKANKAG